MSVLEFILGKNAAFKFDDVRGTTVRVVAGDIWLTQNSDPKDYILKTGEVMPLKDEGTTIITAFQPSLLELYRKDPVALREEIERQSHRARNKAIRAFFARIFY